MGENEFIFINEDDIAEHIFGKLMEIGIVVKREDIKLILELETEYLIENGHAIIMEDDDEY